MMKHVETMPAWIDWVRKTPAVHAEIYRDGANAGCTSWAKNGGIYTVVGEDKQGNSCMYRGWLSIPLILDGLGAITDTADLVDVEAIRQANQTCVDNVVADMLTALAFIDAGLHHKPKQAKQGGHNETEHNNS